MFVWVPDEALAALKPGALPGAGIEVQMLDHGYAEQYEKATGQEGRLVHDQRRRLRGRQVEDEAVPADSRPNGSRSFPRKNLSKGVGEWNHYYVRAINGEVRLWVNGEEVSGGSGGEPRTGYLCLESEGSPVEFKEHPHPRAAVARRLENARSPEGGSGALSGC